MTLIFTTFGMKHDFLPLLAKPAGSGTDIDEGLVQARNLAAHHLAAVEAEDASEVTTLLR